jgi:hypothetical protein
MAMISIFGRMPRVAKGRLAIASIWIVAMSVAAGFCTIVYLDYLRFSRDWNPSDWESTMAKSDNVTSALLTILSLDPAVQVDTWRKDGPRLEHAGSRKSLDWVPDENGASGTEPYVRVVNPEAEAFPNLQANSGWAGRIVVQIRVGDVHDCRMILNRISSYRGILENFEMALPRGMADGARIRWVPIDPRRTESPDRICLQQYLGEQFVGQKDELWFRPIDRTSKDASLSDTVVQ